MTVQAIIFDCDGTLVDSETSGSQVFADLLTEEGLPMTAAEVLLAFRGCRLATSMAEAARRLGRPLSTDFEHRLRHRTAQALRDGGLPEIEGALALVESLTLPFCVASNATRDKTELNLELTGLLPHFAGRIFSAYEVGAWKPDPGLFLHAAASMGIAPARCLVIEDSEPGVAAALAAGMQVLALIHDNRPSWLPQQVRGIRTLSEVGHFLATA